MRATLAASAALIVATLVAGSAAASTTNTYVTNVFVGQDGTVAFDIADAKAQHPSCSSTTNNFVFRSTTGGGGSMLAALLTAKATDRPVTIFGSDACAIDGGTENMTGIIIKP